MPSFFCLGLNDALSGFFSRERPEGFALSGTVRQRKLTRFSSLMVWLLIGYSHPPALLLSNLNTSTATLW